MAEAEKSPRSVRIFSHSHKYGEESSLTMASLKMFNQVTKLLQLDRIFLQENSYFVTQAGLRLSAILSQPPTC